MVVQYKRKSDQGQGVNLYTNPDLPIEEYNQEKSNTQKISRKEERDKKFDQKSKPTTDVHSEELNIPINDQYVFQRILGHLEIIGGHRWVEREDCWICNKWRYVIFIWSKLLSDQVYESKPVKFL